MNLSRTYPSIRPSTTSLLVFVSAALSHAAGIDHHVLDAGGGPSASASYRNQGAVGGIGGFSSGPGSRVVNHAGFAGQLNETPELPVRILERVPGRPLKIDPALISDGLADPEGDTFVVESIASTSAAGMAVRPDGRWLVYEATPAAPASDSFTYLVVDGIGDRALGVVTILEQASGSVTVGASQTLLHIEPLLPTLSYRISFAGIPGRNYRVETATNVVDGPWSTLSFGLAGPDGLYAVTNTPPVGEGARFYRSFHQP
jgi:hypothetical protein